MASSAITVTDERTGETRRVEITDGSIPAAFFAQLKAPGDRSGLVVFDQGYTNTAACRSRITSIDGERGELRYRGYLIEELVDAGLSFLDVAFLLIHGELPTPVQSASWRESVMTHTFVHEDLLHLVKSFRYDAHPMGLLGSAVSAMGTFHSEANPALAGVDVYDNPALRFKQVVRLLGKLPTLAAAAYRLRTGRPFNYPDSSLGYVENLVMMLDKLSESEYRADPRLVRALNVLFILHADHELNCSTAAVRHLASSGVDPYTAVAGGIGALYGPLHGGANEAVVRMLGDIGSVDNVPAFLERVKNREVKLMGFGHRIYKTMDPRARIVRRCVDDVAAVLGTNPKLEVALALEKAALADPWLQERNLAPNVDFFSGIIFESMGFPLDFFPCLFAMPRVAGWLAHWVESLDDKRRIVRPRQIYVGPAPRSVPAPASDEEEVVDGVPTGRGKLLRFHARL